MSSVITNDEETLMETDDSLSRVSEESTRALQEDFMAIRLSFFWFGTQRTLSKSQKITVAQQFKTDPNSLSADKRLYDTRHPAIRKLTALRTEIQNYVHGVSMAYTEPGMRLIRRDKMESIHEHLTDKKREMRIAVDELRTYYNALKEEAQARLQDLYNPDDYREDMLGRIGFNWSYPAITPPPYLQLLRQDIYDREVANAKARLKETVLIMEETFVTELKEMVSHLAERLTGVDEEGRQKTFKDSSVEKLGEFFERFKMLNVSSNKELEDLVTKAKSVLGNVEAKELRKNVLLRTEIAGELQQVSELLDAQISVMPRRRLIREE